MKRPLLHWTYFNPRSPRGLRLGVAARLFRRQSFQSTQPKRAATDGQIKINPADTISIHAAQEGCDCGNKKPLYYKHRFQSTQPKRAATVIFKTCINWQSFQSTQPKRAATFRGLITGGEDIFQSTQPKRAATVTRALLASVCLIFQSTQPKRAATGRELPKMQV